MPNFSLDASFGIREHTPSDIYSPEGLGGTEMGTLDAVEKLRKLRAESRKFAGFTEQFAKLRADSGNDKIGYEFEPRTDRFQSFGANISFTSYCGRYGSSSCGTILQADAELAQIALIKALNIHQQAIFKTMAEVLNDSANALVEKARAEIEQVEAMLAAVETEAALERA